MILQGKAALHKAELLLLSKRCLYYAAVARLC